MFSKNKYEKIEYFQKTSIKKLYSILLICAVFAMIFATTVLTKTTIGSGSKYLNGFNTLTVTASQAPKYVYVTISICSGVSYGVVTINKPNVTSYSNFGELSGDLFKKC